MSEPDFKAMAREHGLGSKISSTLVDDGHGGGRYVSQVDPATIRYGRATYEAGLRRAAEIARTHGGHHAIQVAATIERELGSADRG